LEEDEAMQELWAALLANASAEDPNDRRISAAFPEILRQISPQDARLMNLLYEIAKENNDWADRSVGNSLQIQARVPELNQEQLVNCLENLLHHSLLDTDIAVMSGSQGRREFEARERNFAVSPFGARFVLACQPPKKKQ
jgi:abortive infection alpha-like protein